MMRDSAEGHETGPSPQKCLMYLKSLPDGIDRMHATVTVLHADTRERRCERTRQAPKGGVHRDDWTASDHDLQSAVQVGDVKHVSGPRLWLAGFASQPSSSSRWRQPFHVGAYLLLRSSMRSGAARSGDGFRGRRRHDRRRHYSQAVAVRGDRGERACAGAAPAGRGAGGARREVLPQAANLVCVLLRQRLRLRAQQGRVKVCERRQMNMRLPISSGR
jgi:hypothetical protein